GLASELYPPQPRGKRATLSAMSLVRKAPRGAIVVRAVAFGNPDGSVWGAGLGAGVPALVAAGSAEPVAVTIAWRADTPEWGLTGNRVSLTVSPMVPPSAEPAPQAGGVGSAGALPGHRNGRRRRDRLHRRANRAHAGAPGRVRLGPRLQRLGLGRRGGHPAGAALGVRSSSRAGTARGDRVWFRRPAGE